MGIHSVKKEKFFQYFFVRDYELLALKEELASFKLIRLDFIK